MSDSINQTRFLNPWKLHLQKLGLELKCPLCLMLFKEPMLLPCNHIFCKSCISTADHFGDDCLVCKAPYAGRDLKAAPFMLNMVTIYNTMEATLNACLNHSTPDGTCTPSVTPKTEDGICETPNVIQVSFSGSPPFSGGTSDPGNEQSPQKYSLKRPAEKCFIHRAGHEESCSPIPNRQKRLNYGPQEPWGKSDNPCHAVGSDFVETPVPSPTSELERIGSHKVKTVCALCQSSKQSQATGEMLHLSDGERVVGDYIGHPNVIHVHEKCIDWAPQVYYSGETVKNLDSELARGAKLKCSSCGLKGATLGCYSTKCKRSYHAPCAVVVEGCRWDCDNFLLLCPTHISTRFPNEKSRPLKPVISKKPLPVPKSKPLDESNFSSTSPHESQELILCGSALSNEEKILLFKFASIHGIKVSKTWKPSVTHVIASTDVNGACCRTLKVLMAILHGKWILTIDWVKTCMEAIHLVDEEPYEVSMDNHGCRDGPKTGRLRLLANGPKLLSGFQLYFSCGFVLEYMKDLQTLVRAAGGMVLKNNREELITQVHDDPSTILVVYNLDTSLSCKLGEEDSIVQQRLLEAQKLAAKIGSRVIGHTWLLESIAACKLQPFANCGISRGE